jgi:hypothetical protein
MLPGNLLETAPAAKDPNQVNAELPAKRENTEQVTAPQAPTREQLFQECKELAEATCLLPLFEQELRQRGVVGDVTNFKIILLATLSRFSERPISVVLKGDATAGKSFTMNTVLEYVPNEAYESMSGMSEKALIYWDRDLRNKMLFIGEFTGLQSEQGNTWLRQLLTEGCIRYVVTGDGKGSGRASLDLEVAGPTGLIMTTTAQKLHPEDESRMISLFVDDSPEHTLAVIRSQAMKAAGLQTTKPNTAPWVALHRWVAAGSKAVVVPFALTLSDKVDPSNGRMKRDFPKVLDLVKAHALLHQQTRERSAEGQIIATLADYQAIYALLARPLSEGQTETLAPEVDQVISAVSVLSSLDGYREGVPQNAIVDHFANGDQQQAVAKSTVSRRVRKALDQGYLTVGQHKPGVGQQLKIGISRGKVSQTLPAPETLGMTSTD